jgi:hypothetical protein
MNELVKRLSEGVHPVELVLRPERTAEALKACLKRRYVHIKFTATRGGTELGVRIDDDMSQGAMVALDDGAETLHLSGNLVLDYVPVRCVADIDLANWQGTGCLEVRASDEVRGSVEPAHPSMQ